MRNEQQERHTLVLEQTYPSGAEEWYCPECGRRFVMQWPPAYSRIVLEVGDETAIHNAAKGGLSMGAPQFSMETETSAENEAALAPWKEWLEKANLENRLDEEF